jgi:hypothetical protein
MKEEDFLPNWIGSGIEQICNPEHNTYIKLTEEDLRGFLERMSKDKSEPCLLVSSSEWDTAEKSGINMKNKVTAYNFITNERMKYFSKTFL